MNIQYPTLNIQLGLTIGFMNSSRPAKAALLPALAALIAGLPLAARSAPEALAPSSNAVHVTRFELVSHGITVGQGRILRRPLLHRGEACREVRLLIESKVNLVFYKFAMRMEESWLSTTNGLIAYRCNNTENGQSKTITGELANGVFRFETVDGGKTSVWTAARTAYDFASISQPEPVPAAGATNKFSVLDPNTCAITERIYRGGGTEMLAVGTNQVQCQTITIEYPGTCIRRWFITDEFGPLILREDGDQPRGSYSRRAVSMGLEEKADDSGPAQK
jgi:hypothetical protein